MQAKDVMTRDVVVVAPDTPVPQIARILLDHAISGVPVVDSSGVPVGMISEGDLIVRSSVDRESRRDWWLALLAEGHSISPEFLSSLTQRHETAKEIMVAPVITVEEDTDVSEIARLLASYRIKRLPVISEGRIVGIVSRADLLKTLASQHAGQAGHQHVGFLAEAFENVDRRFFSHPHESVAVAQSRPAKSSNGGKVEAADFRALAADYEHAQMQRYDEERHAEANRRKKQVKQLIDEHIEDSTWNDLMHKAREAAEAGQQEFQLLRFPSQLCSDGGRAINVEEPNWPATLRGKAAEIYWRWERDLRPHGFHLRARVLEFPSGMPGDIGLFLIWGD